MTEEERRRRSFWGCHRAAPLPSSPSKDDLRRMLAEAAANTKKQAEEESA